MPLLCNTVAQVHKGECEASKGRERRLRTGEHVRAVAVPDQAAQPVVLHEPEQVEAAAVHRQDRHRAVPQPPDSAHARSAAAMREDAAVHVLAQDCVEGTATQAAWSLLS